MAKANTTKIDESTLTKVATWLTDAAVNGIGPLSSSIQLAQEYKIDNDYPDNDARVDSLINWETSKNFTSGFVTGLGGLIYSASYASSWTGGVMGNSSTDGWRYFRDLWSLG